MPFVKKIKARVLERLHILNTAINRTSFFGIFLFSMAGIGTMILDIGFVWNNKSSRIIEDSLNTILQVLLVLYLVQTAIAFIPSSRKLSRNNIISKFIIVGILIILVFRLIPSNSIGGFFGTLLHERTFQYIILSIIFLRALSRYLSRIYHSNVDASRLFIYSFLFIIMLGSFLLMLPQATTTPIRYIDALFTSTSAVCVTGLASVDTAIQFTDLGKFILLMLIQIGGLGVMTFTSFFALFLSGSGSLHEHNVLGTMIVSKTFNRLLKSLYAVFIVTILFEFVGAILIYHYTPAGMFDSVSDRIEFSVFHSVSAFCNAGFSTVSGGLMHGDMITNYPVQLIIAALIIFGGLGFHLISNYMEFYKVSLQNIWRHYVIRKPRFIRPRILYFNSRIAVFTTAILILGGTLLFYFLEQNNTLSNHTGAGKWIAAFFCAVTPRTAGFNTIDFGALMLPTILLTIFLMWVGASPGSTGGGIKTTTFAISFLNVISVGRGNRTISIFNREISNSSIRKAMVVVFFSIMIVMSATFLLSIFEPQASLASLMFEAFSAFGTVGLSMNLTPSLSDGSKIVLITLMFIGRIGIITLVFGLIRERKFVKYRLPEEEILI